MMSASEEIPVLSGDEARNIDLEVTEKLGRVRVLESVATRIADTIDYYLAIPKDQAVLFVAGKGNNGANCIAAARILHFRGRNVSLVLLFDPKMQQPPGQHKPLRPNTLEQLELFDLFVGSSSLHPLDFQLVKEFKGLVVDGILGTGISDPPRGLPAQGIDAINSNPSKVLSVDMPSGLNHVTGEAPGVCVKSTWTINLHMLKSGQLQAPAKEYVGELWSAESALGYSSFPGLESKFRSFYASGPIRKV